MRTFRLHFERGISRKKYDDLIARLGYGAWQYRPVKGETGYIAAVDVLTGDLESAQFAATKITSRGKRRVVRTKVVRVEELNDQPAPLLQVAREIAPVFDRLIEAVKPNMSRQAFAEFSRLAGELRRAIAIETAARRSGLRTNTTNEKGVTSETG